MEPASPTIGPETEIDEFAPLLRTYIQKQRQRGLPLPYLPKQKEK